jgi:broad specificity phosphatase PhoE
VNVFAIRHGETAWSLSGQHTGTTDIPLTENGRRLAQRMRLVLATNAFELVLCSPMQRARETCELAGLGDKAVIDSDLVEWNYGDYEGLTPQQIRKVAPGWLIFRDGCPGGEAPEQVGARMDRVIARSRAAGPHERFRPVACPEGMSFGNRRAVDATAQKHACDHAGQV